MLLYILSRCTVNTILNLETRVKCCSTVTSLLTSHEQNDKKFLESGVYEFKCQNYNTYCGQTSRMLKNKSAVAMSQLAVGICVTYFEKWPCIWPC